MNTPRRARSKRQPASNTTTFDIIGMVYGGYGVSQHHGRPIYLPYTIEGEQVEARLLPGQKNAQFAEGVRLLRASRDRVYPECSHFGTCWGCQWQHIAYPAQLLIKFDVVADQLQRHGRFSDAVLGAALQPVIPSPTQWHYNHQATFYRLPDGSLGFHRRDERLTPIDYCWTLRPELQALYESFDIDLANLRSVTLHLGSDGATMVLLHLLADDLPELETDLPTSVNVLLTDREPLNLVGESLVRYEVKGRWLRATAGAFFRANVAQVEALVDEVLRGLELQGDEHVLDLYAGVGTFSAFIAPRCEVVTVVESYPPAVTDADENLADYDNVDVVEGSVLEVLESMQETEARYQAVVLDPPARGMTSEELRTLTALQPQRIVYVSSSPAALGRDGLALTQAGYQLKRVQPLDAAPQTYYADVVATFTR